MLNIVVQSIGDASSEMIKNSQEIMKLSDMAQKVEMKINDAVTLVSSASLASDKTVANFEETTGSVTKIVENITKVNEISHGNANSVEEITATAQNLNALTKKLNQSLETFRT